VRPTDCGEQSRQEPIGPYDSTLLKAPGIRIRDSAVVFRSSAKDDAEVTCTTNKISANTFSHRGM